MLKSPTGACRALPIFEWGIGSMLKIPTGSYRALPIFDGESVQRALPQCTWLPVKKVGLQGVERSLFLKGGICSMEPCYKGRGSPLSTWRSSAMTLCCVTGGHVRRLRASDAPRPSTRLFPCPPTKRQGFPRSPPPEMSTLHEPLYSAMILCCVLFPLTLKSPTGGYGALPI